MELRKTVTTSNAELIIFKRCQRRSYFFRVYIADVEWEEVEKVYESGKEWFVVCGSVKECGVDESGKKEKGVRRSCSINIS